MRLGLIGACLFALGVTAGVAREQIPAEERWWPFNANLPACDSAEVIDRVRARFADKESGYWASDLRIVSVEKVRTIAMRPNGLDLIPRRYCAATAHLSNLKASPLYYSIGEDTGMAGYGYGVHFCVAGYDRNWANAPGCKMARP